MVNNIKLEKYNLGLTVMEMMIVIAIMGILAAIAIPSYQNHVIDTKRGIMMAELQDLSSKISKQKVIQGSYRNITATDIVPAPPQNKYPVSEETKLYSVTLTGLETGKWTLTATPDATSIMAGDGDLTLNYTGYKCHDTKCGTGDQWK